MKNTVTTTQSNSCSSLDSRKDEASELIALLKQHKVNVRLAADEWGVDESTIYKKVKILRISLEKVREELGISAEKISEELRRENYTTILKRHEGIVELAADELGISQSYLYSELKKLGISAKQIRDEKKKEVTINALEKSQGVGLKAARRLKVCRAVVYKRVKRWQIPYRKPDLSTTQRKVLRGYAQYVTTSKVRKKLRKTTKNVRKILAGIYEKLGKYEEIEGGIAEPKNLLIAVEESVHTGRIEPIDYSALYQAIGKHVSKAGPAKTREVTCKVTQEVPLKKKHTSTKSKSKEEEYSKDQKELEEWQLLIDKYYRIKNSYSLVEDVNGINLLIKQYNALAKVFAKVEKEDLLKLTAKMAGKVYMIKEIGFGRLSEELVKRRDLLKKVARASKQEMQDSEYEIPYREF